MKRNVYQLFFCFTILFFSSPVLAGWVISDGSKLQVNTGFYSQNDVNIQSNAEMLVFGEVSIEGILTNNAGNNGIIILHSTGSLINASANVDANFRLSGYQQEQWHLISSPVLNQDPFALFDNQSTDWLLYLQEFDEASNQWNDWATNPNGTYEMSPLSGYAMWVQHTGSPRYLDATNMSGKLNTGTIGTTDNYFRSNEGWQVSGNPYPSYIDLDAPAGFTWTNMEKRAWFWKQGEGNYGYYDLTTETGTLGVTNMVDPGQGFLVRVASSGTASFIMDDQVRSHSASGSNFQKSADVNVLHVIAINLGEDEYRDELLFAENNDASLNYDPIFDATKFWGNMEAPQIYALKDLPLSLYSIPMLAEETTFEIGFACNTAGEFNLSFPGLTDFSPNYPVFLKDKITGNTFSLNYNPNYTFIHQPENPEDRFQLSFKEALGVNVNDNYEPIKIQVLHNMVSVKFGENSSGEIFITNIIGQRLFYMNFMGEEVNFQTELKPAAYILTVITDRRMISEKIIFR